MRSLNVEVPFAKYGSLTKETSIFREQLPVATKNRPHLLRGLLNCEPYKNRAQNQGCFAEELP